jgi:signal transduction histidine kinase
MRQPPLDALRFHPLPELAAALRASTDRILSRWRDEVLRLVPQADQLTLRQLDNSLPDLLERTATALQADQPDPTAELQTIAPAHGVARFHEDYNLNELLIEYSLLRRIVLEELTEERGGAQLSVAETVEINQAIDVAMRGAVRVFSEHQANELRIQANAMAKYLSFLSHDLRGGLNGVMLMIEVLRRDLASESRFSASVEDLDSMRRSMLETVATMDRFLSAEKLRRGRMPIKVEPVNIRGLCLDIARFFGHQLEAAQEIQLDADPSIEIHTDRELLSMILQNVLSNAIKYGRGKNVSLSATSPPQKAGGCIISVADRGYGIALDKLATLFTPFTRGETYGQQGVGLGLFISRQAADLLGGRLWAESTPGEGTTFHVRLPATPPPPEPPEE